MFQVKDIPVMNKALDALRVKLLGLQARQAELKLELTKTKSKVGRNMVRCKLDTVKSEINRVEKSIMVLEIPPKR